MKIWSPEGRLGARRATLAEGPDVLTGHRLVVLDNGKPGAAILMTRVAERLVERGKVEFVGVQRKRTAATPCDAAMIEEIVRGADIALTGTAD